jgi:hypothetical protein
MQRRRFLQAGAAAAGLVPIAGCLSSRGSSDLPADRLGWQRDGVFVPKHASEMVMAGMARDGRYRAVMSYVFPHYFYLVRGRQTEQAGIQPDDSAHMMVTLWDEQTETVVPAADARMQFRQNGQTRTRVSLWPMLSQRMGLHFGDNIALPGSGTYTVEATVSPTSARLTRGLRDGLDERASLTFDIEFSRERAEDIPFKRPSNIGDADAIAPMEMSGVPNAQLPPAAEMPGRLLGETTSDDGQFVVTALDEPPAGIEASGTYLVVSARTPYNRFPLALMSLSARLERDGEAVGQGSVPATLDPELGYHYGMTVDGVESGDRLRLAVGTPPQMARHGGYETAFLQMGEMSLTV